MLLVLEIIMILMGLWALGKGKLQITKNRVLEGRRARITGLVLILPIPLALVLSLAMSRMMSKSTGMPITMDPAGFEFLFIIVAFIFAAIQKPTQPDFD